MVEPEESDDESKPGPTPSDDDIKLLRLLNSISGGFGTARDIEPKTDVGYKQTRNRLDDLADKGLLNRRMVGTTKVYWLTSEGELKLQEAEF